MGLFLTRIPCILSQGLVSVAIDLFWESVSSMNLSTHF